ncbi:MAG: DUF3320 domain-containing protein, partial [Planctomycetota bacterium]
QTVGAIDQHPYRDAGLTRYQTGLPNTLKKQCGLAEEAVRGVSDAAASMLDTLELEGHADTAASPAELSAQGLAWLVSLGQMLQEPQHPTARLLTEPGFVGIRRAVSEQIERGKARDAERDRLLARYHERVLDEDLGQLRSKLADGMTALPVVSWLKCYGPRKRIGLCIKQGKVPTNPELLNDLDALIRLRDASRGLASEDNPGSRYAGDNWLRGEAQWEAILALLDWAERYREHLEAPAASAFGDLPARQALGVGLAIDRREGLLAEGRLKRATGRLAAAGATLDQRLESLNALMMADPVTAWGLPEDAGYLDNVSTTLEDWSSQTGRLRDWTHWCTTRNDALSCDLGALIEAYRARAVSPGRFVEVVVRGVLTQWHDAVCDAQPVLGSFHSGEHERQIARFRAIDERYLDLTARQVRATLAERVPLLFGEPSANSEVGILKRQLKLKRRHMPVRRLIRELPNLLPRLKPCLLMSPLSVAQYLDADDAEASGGGFGAFDLVVFDEASQIPVWDAVGAIARGKSCVVVGDSKQLPPTSFFQKLETGDDGGFGVPDENDFEELESILDECAAGGLPSMRLAWHYRSRHESLIAFSNVHYYDGELNTFPSPVDETDTLGVSLRHLEDAVYDRGKTCTNPTEARALVAEVMQRLKTYTIESYQSIGIVTFSMAQQVLIEDLLDEARRDHPQIDPFFTTAVEEPVFIKNLENVQGDERAEIFFSICYGPDREGKVAMNFGPLNREGGERRLNVAITRARRRVAVFTSLRADQIDLSRTQAVGVRHLRGFLDYAARGADALAEPAYEERETGSLQTALEQDVAAALRGKGHGVDLDVGMSGYRVSLAVRDPDRPGRYLVGVECDGPYYRRAPAARDRDRTRPAVMAGLGWRLVRLWSLDYWHHPARALEEIERAIERARRGEPEPDLTATIEQGRAASASATPRRPRMMPGMALYKPYLPDKPAGDHDQFYDPAKTSALQRSLLRIAKHEAPIHRELLARRVLYAWQVSRLTGKAQQRVDQVTQRAVDAGELRVHEPFVWLAEQDPATYPGFRVPPEGEEAPRHIEEVPPTEVANAAVAVLRQMIAMPRDELDREVAVLFGFSRVTGRVQPTIDEAVQRMLDEGRCVYDPAGNVALPG